MNLLDTYLIIHLWKSKEWESYTDFDGLLIGVLSGTVLAYIMGGIEEENV
jgi:hypothetical protein